jgi:NTE family protein
MAFISKQAVTKKVNPHAIDSSTTETDQIVLVLQGGGALGAYQAGVFEALSHAEIEPDWVAGISIGAINSALIAGNPPERRVSRLEEFWQLVSFAWPALPWINDGPVRSRLNEASAALFMLFGVPGFFTPRVPPSLFQPAGTPGAISYYDTTPLTETLERLIDFDLLNSGPVRLSVGAVNVRTGNFAYFDSASQRIDVRHILASAALPPGFAPVEIDGEHYWDGGLVSNTPLQYVLDQPATRHLVAFQVDLFPALGKLPANLADVREREKDIRFSSRTRLNTDLEVDRHLIARAVQRLVSKLPPELRDDPDAQTLARLRGERHGIDIVHLIYRSKNYEGDGKDYEFSRLSMHEHWQAGYADLAGTLQDPRWLARERSPDGVRVFDLTADQPVSEGLSQGASGKCGKEVDCDTT